MGENIMCNYCLVADIRRRAKKSNRSVTIVSDERNTAFPLSKNVYVSPNEVVCPQDQGKKYFAIWVAALPNVCRC